MGPRNATRRPGGGVSAVTCSLAKTSATEDSAITVNRQAVTLPTLADARARLLEVISRRPAPKREVTILDVRAWERAHRRRDAMQVLQAITGTADVAIALRCAPSTVRRWRSGTSSPTVRHWRQLLALRALLHGRWS